MLTAPLKHSYGFNRKGFTQPISSNRSFPALSASRDVVHFGQEKASKPLKIGILVGNIHSSEQVDINRLKEAAEEKGHRVTTIAVEDCHALIKDGKGTLMLKGKPLEALDIVIPRLGSVPDLKSIVQAELIIDQFRIAGFPLLEDKPDAISTAINKFKAHQAFARNNVSTLNSAFSIKLTADPNISKLIANSKQLIVKLVTGTTGDGVFLTPLEGLKKLLEKLNLKNSPLMIQEFAQEAKGADMRCVVVGDKVVGTMGRQALNNGWKANYTLGAKATHITNLPDTTKELAINAVKALGLAYGGVDIINTKDGPAVIEVNASPNIVGMEGCIGKIMAPAIIQHVEKYVEQLQKTI
ncbi:MAG: RimK family alpha-L-glutamate ligase [Vampirovibrio sp.]|nr:RimK family alpha-L-glutamate ligase [Vampirovibrio sp.]